ncbi:MAG: hypothetical protein HFI65_06465 [Lachnospiraceae bacterium]|nr:hypothetical protein [Lachnospiraceae bacterium]
MLGFVIWMLAGTGFVVFGIYAAFSRRTMPFGFWANAKVFEVTDVKGYNRAVGILWCVFGVCFALLGLPLLPGQNSAWVLFSVLGAMAEAITAMAVYTVGIEGKYRKR